MSRFRGWPSDTSLLAMCKFAFAASDDAARAGNGESQEEEAVKNLKIAPEPLKLLLPIPHK